MKATQAFPNMSTIWACGMYSQGSAADDSDGNIIGGEGRA